MAIALTKEGEGRRGREEKIEKSIEIEYEIVSKRWVVESYSVEVYRLPSLILNR